jgi:hypothetical protein
VQAPLPPDEAERLKALRRYEILDTNLEQDFDDIMLLGQRATFTLEPPCPTYEYANE